MKRIASLILLLLCICLICGCNKAVEVPQDAPDDEIVEEPKTEKLSYEAFF